MPPAGRTARLCRVVTISARRRRSSPTKGRCESLPRCTPVAHHTSSAGPWFCRGVGRPVDRSLYDWIDYTSLAERGAGNRRLAGVCTRLVELECRRARYRQDLVCEQREQAQPPGFNHEVVHRGHLL